MRPTVTLTQTISTCFYNLMKEVGTSVPAVVLSFDSAKQLAQIQIAIQGVAADGSALEQPPIIAVPVYFAGNSDFSIQHEVKAGDEGIAVFSQRCIDGFVTQGANQPNPVLRFHDFTDAMFLPGLRSSPNKISDFNADGIGIYKNDGSQKISIKSDGTIEITTTGAAAVDINGSKLLPGGIITCASIAPGAIVPPPPPTPGDPTPPVTISGDITIAGDITVTGTVDGVNIGQHKHASGTYTTTDGPVSGESGAPT